MPQRIKINTFLAFFANLFLLLPTGAIAQEIYRDMVADDSLKTVRLHKEGWETSWPFIHLGQDDSLVLSFDDLHNDMRDYSYRIRRCDKAWQASDLFVSEYMNGFEVNPIDDYEMSINTIYPYTHYRQKIPESGNEIRLSGNYVIEVFETDLPDSVLLRKGFFVADQNAHVDGEVREVSGMYRSMSQDVDFRVQTSALGLSDIYADLDVRVMRNMEWHSERKDLRPSFVNTGEVVFEDPDQAVFKGVTEYRYFNLRNLKMTNEEVASIDFSHPDYFVSLFPDKSRRFRAYSSREDMNGRYVISNRAGWEAVTDADYVQVKFFLPSAVQIHPGGVYIFGELSQWQLLDDYKMSYEAEEGGYVSTVLLKQGYYDYRYVVEDANGSVDATRFEGSHNVTENAYIVRVYYRDRSCQCDRLASFALIPSVKKD